MCAAVCESTERCIHASPEIAVRVLKNFPAVKDDCEDFSRNIPASAGCRNSKKMSDRYLCNFHETCIIKAENTSNFNSKNHMRVSNLMWFLLNNGRAYVDIEV